MRPSLGHRAWSLTVAGILIPALVLAGCEDPTLGQGIVVRNETDVDVTFEWLPDGEVVTMLGELAPGNAQMLIAAANLTEGGRFGTGGCTTVPVVARGPDGEQIARADPPLCVGDEWVIEAP